MLGLLSPFSLVQNFLGASASAVGVDLGTETLRLAQVQADPESPELVAAASRDVPPGAAEEPVAYAEFCASAIKELWREGGFEGRKAVLGIPSSMMHLLHLRLPKLEASAIPAALAFEAAGKLPFDPVAGILRHHVVGDVYTNDGPRQEVVCTAVRRDYVELLLNAAEKARLEIAGLVAAPMALRDCFTRIYRRSSDAETGFCFVDIGRSATRVTIIRAGHLYFARSIAIGSEHLNKAVGDAVGVQPTEAKLLRSQLADQQSQAEAERAQAPAQQAAVHAGNAAGPEGSEQHGGALLGAATGEGRRGLALAASEHGAQAYVMAPPKPAARVARATSSLITEMSVAQAIEPVLHQLADELQRCRRYHEATFPNVALDRLVFVGGEAHGRALCQSLARRLSIAAQIGDPIASLCHDITARRQHIDLSAAGIDRRRQQPAWAVACGLSLGAPA